MRNDRSQPRNVFVDTHAHLNLDLFDSDRDEVVQRAREAGVEMILDVGTDLKSSRRAVEDCERHDGVYAVVGIHPHDASRMKGKGDLSEIEKLLDHPKVVGVGEIGLDYHYDFSPREIQQEVFARQLRLAKGRGLPVVVHVRKAMQDGLKILGESGDPPWEGVFHCFGGTVEDVPKVLEMGFFISFTGVVTFRNFRNFDKIRGVPLERLLLETDAPYMAPVPHRGRRNEPCFLVHTARLLAEVYGVGEERLAEVTTANARILFDLRN